MKVGIMQPYFVPYLGYWQLINAVDTYVIFDDVNFIKKGWINRNRLLVNGTAHYFNIPIMSISQNKKINELSIEEDLKWRAKNLRTIEMAYKKAPFYLDIYPLIKKIILCSKKNLAEYLTESINLICTELDIKTELILSSKIEKDNTLKGQEKIIEMCEILKATEYYNAIGGKELYSFNDFEAKNICLKFLKPGVIEYRQFGTLFQPNLSIIDVMMFNGKEKTKEMLENYELI